MSFGMYLLVIFCPPLYFAVRKRWVAMVINGMFYLAAIPLLFIGVGIILWGLCALHAAWDLMHVIREKQMQRQAALIVEKMQEKK